MKGKIMKKRMKSKALGLSIMLTAGCILTACNPNNSTLNTTLTENPSADLTDVSDFNDSEIITSEIITSEINPSEELPSDELPFSDAGPKGILGESGTIGDYEYTLQGSDTEGPNLERGWYIMRSDGNPVLIMISSGRRNTGGYSINIKDIGEAPKTDDSDASTLQITVEETSPAEGQITTEALTNPVCYIGFNTDPGMLSVKNQNGVELEYKGEWGFEIEVEGPVAGTYYTLRDIVESLEASNIGNVPADSAGAEKENEVFHDNKYTEEIIMSGELRNEG